MNLSKARQRVRSKGAQPAAPGTVPEASHKTPWSYAIQRAALVFGLAIVAALSLPSLQRAVHIWRPRAFRLAPLGAPVVTDSILFDDAYRERMYWGTYRSGFYCGIRGREPKSILAGVMWADMADTQRFDIRHVARHEDQLEKYGWVRHNLRSFGRQEIIDRGVLLQTLFQKTASGGYGGDWTLRINATAVSDARRTASPQFSLFFYIGHEDGVTGNVQVRTATPKMLRREGGAIVASGASSTRPGAWSLHAKGGPSVSSVTAASLRVPVFFNMSDVAMQLLVANYRQSVASSAEFDYTIASARDAAGNVVLLQIQADLPFSVDFAFVGGLDASASVASATSKELAARVQPMVGAALTAKLSSEEQDFMQRYTRLFASASKPGAVDDLALAALSNTVGSMGYFWGSSLVRMPSAEGGAAGEVARTAERPLFTAVPSRSFFPRGFLWDEGFHELLVQQWDVRASCEVLAHWLDLMNEDGWIPREMILGLEAESRVPSEYIEQHPDAANPPTLFLPIMTLARAAADPQSRLLADADVERRQLLDFLYRAWPRLGRWLDWFERSQAGPVPSSYRWAGRNSITDRELNPKTLTSGLDDFPRASHPSGDERHLDLRCWMAFAAQAMAIIGQELELPAHVVAPYKKRAASLMDLGELKQLHLHKATGMFLDWGLHTEDVELVRATDGVGGLVRVVTGEEPRLQYVPHFGYNSLFPLALQVLPADSPELQQQITLLQRPDLLWTPFGLRSLSSSSSLYDKYNTEHDAPYWRGPIWINLNFLVLRALHTYARDAGPYQDSISAVYRQLRHNVLENVAKQYAKASGGYLWENYNDKTGKGMGSHPFTGWTALVALITMERY